MTNHDRAAARAACEAGYITTAEYLSIADQFDRQFNEHFPVARCGSSIVSERPAPAVPVPPSTPAGAGSDHNSTHDLLPQDARAATGGTASLVPATAARHPFEMSP